MNGEANSSGISVEHDPETGTYVATFESAELDPSTAVVEVMATIRDADPVELDPLFGAIDPEELDSIIERRHSHEVGDTLVEFTYLDHVVTVKSYGVIEVEPVSDGGAV